MSSNNWQLQPSELFAAGPVVPVIVISKIEQALPLAKALLDGGIRVMEVTLRTECAVEAIRVIAKEYPESLIGSGTVINAEQLAQVTEAGAKFAISPGSTPALLAQAAEGSIPLIPGVVSPSELMSGIELGYDHFKFFPAESNGGSKALKSLGAPFKGIKFCPTGGISLHNAPEYLALDAVSCIGGSWIVPLDLVEAGEWQQITQLCKEAVAALS
ncbi:bifunctional 4-hydroxy-2-oxoglutarate aldolase/2-dehydro-3-deoxy-phosphogluconate aldolase [Psychrobium sp. 1_MG-2023]|uniref:bifunctional 4-hydroxy-2-oxoglutarate aldolase/2-dehydro-3-deoxy-phosphogluconate aldolase n=1 Tax=Psychrobium sp. 1_MG-2023 TaxID=3062624 RepID=UPI000C342D31|nr:bifunctional 4-hydroxy-2-oxoglutarate aldolase/2-dehydro-3-deoxy-phosphogluconate aldolase [Psychrobium sp. 1_MG-2023]MDP2561165.1 bifunctional 4-hydroxy-2-oxoglutarate aldolase/2-dehydro-3-deoxy-phosphogluconate aldolase [Psychrobium sp. 1_MG-2023]PKF55139.1 keto-deoxy-phosphogluconate aldolase [Alteromonadales bacterium alter-6D02]